MSASLLGLIAGVTAVVVYIMFHHDNDQNNK